MCELIKDINRYPYVIPESLRKIVLTIKSKHIDTFYNKHVDGLREVYFFYTDNIIPFEGVYTNSNIYYEYSRMKYENPNMKTYLNLNVLFHEGEIPGQEGEFLNPQRLNLTKILLDFNENETTFLSMLQETFNKIGDEADRIYCQFDVNKETTLFIYFEEEGEINYPPFIELCELPQREMSVEEERVAHFRREHQQSLETVEEINQRSAFEFTESDFERFWKENKENFLDGTYNIWMVRYRKDREGNRGTNNYKNK